jgi:AraC family transcriptional regulator of adaptative response/methylated-DNA-[protein]-cysteine methyltransferase
MLLTEKRQGNMRAATHAWSGDGPLRRKPPERIRYGTGRSAVGPVLVALNAKGVVSIMVRNSRARLVIDLRVRFSKAELIADGKGCAAAIAKVVRYIASPIGRFPLSLDIRGTALQQRVWAEVRKIRFGATSTYTGIAAAIGAPRAVRAVAASCSRCWFAFAIPCHRVLHKGGATPANRRDGRQYRWVDYEARLAAQRRRGSARSR